MAFFLNFFGSFKKSAQELKSVRCIAVTAVLIALACILKTLTIQPMPTLKIGFAFVAIASIGMLYGPTVAGLSCVATDVIGYLISNQQLPVALLGRGGGAHLCTDAVRQNVERSA